MTDPTDDTVTGIVRYLAAMRAVVDRLLPGQDYSWFPILPEDDPSPVHTPPCWARYEDGYITPGGEPMTDDEVAVIRTIRDERRARP